ncbi:MAG: hypothetical protein ACRDYX_06340 [Egibacteraceae bacterium]
MPMDGITRRRLLVAVGALGAAALTGCARSGGQRAAPSSTGGLAVVAPGAQPSMDVGLGQSEVLVGKAQRVAFGLATVENRSIDHADVRVRFVAENGRVGVPVQPSFHEGIAGRGTYIARVDVPAPGIGWVVVTAADQKTGGEAPVPARSPEKSQTVPPGGKAISTKTATVADPLGVAQLCTRKPQPCGMHQVSLDQALAAHRPVVLTFATPAFCASATCGPVVDHVESVRTARDWSGIDWIHVEIYGDKDGRTPVQAVQDWHLPSEPWIFTISRDGAVVDRMEGPLVPEELPPLVGRLLR